MNRRSLPSTVEVTILDPLCDSDWDGLVVSHPDFTFFHSAAWAKVVCKTYGHKPVYIHVSQRGESVALIPLIEVLSPFTGRRGVCVPFSDFCGPLVFGENRSTLIMDQLSKLARERKWKYFEIRGGRAFQASAEPVTAFYGHKLDLRDGSEELFEQFTPSNRRAIRKAASSNLHVQVVRTRDAVLQFYRLHIQTRRRHGLPPQPVSFFTNIHENIIKPGLGFIVLVRAGLRDIAGAVFFQFGERAVFKFGASDQRFQRCRGNNLVMWEAINFLVQEGSKVLHFGRTSLDNEGLRQFKLSWGTEEEMIKYYRFDPAKEKWMTCRQKTPTFYNKAFKMLPLGMNRLAGALVYPHLD